MSGKLINILELIENTKKGDNKAQTRLYKYYKKTLEHFLKRKYPKNYDFEDDVSEIAIKIFEKLPTYDNSKSKFNTWVINVANNYMIDKSRKKKLVYVYETNYGAFSNSLTPSETSHNDININSSTLSIHDSCRPDILWENTDSISYFSTINNNSAFTMVDMKSKGYSYSEIGIEFNMTESQVSNKISHYKNKMKKRG
jgi:RNA polymerase sigma factor (sigma-70 family)